MRDSFYTERQTRKHGYRHMRLQWHIMLKHIKTILAIVITILAILGIFIPARTVYTSEGDKTPQEVTQELTVATGYEAYEQIIQSNAERYSISESRIIAIMRCENDTFDPNRQSEVLYSAGQIARNPHWGEVGEREHSYGLVQIHIPAGNINPWTGEPITEELAKDPHFSIQYLAYKINNNQEGMWACSGKV